MKIIKEWTIKWTKQEKQKAKQIIQFGFIRVYGSK